jgi:hypothetical protein
MEMRLSTRRDFLRWGARGCIGIGAIAIVGCGDGDDDSAATPAPDATATPLAAETPAPDATPDLSPAGLRWTQLRSEDGPSPRRDLVVVADDATHVYVFGGHGAEGTTGDLWMYDVPAERWELLDAGSGPSERFGPNMTYDREDHSLLLFGGQLGTTFFQDVWSFDLTGGTWRDDTPSLAPAERYGSGDAFDPATRRWWISHGFTFSGRFDDLWTFDPEGRAWADVTPGGALPIERCLLRCAWDPGRRQVLLFAGQSDVAPVHDDLWVIDPDEGIWREVAVDQRPPPRNRYGGYFDVARDAFVVFGGQGADANLGDTWAFEPESGVWGEVAGGGVPSPRWGQDMAWVAGLSGAVLVGGRDDAADLSDVWLLA